MVHTPAHKPPVEEKGALGTGGEGSADDVVDADYEVVDEDEK